MSGKRRNVGAVIEPMPTTQTEIIDSKNFHKKTLKAIFGKCNEIFNGADFNVVITFFKDGDWQAFGNRCDGSVTKDEVWTDGKRRSVVTTSSRQVSFEKYTSDVRDVLSCDTKNLNGLRVNYRRKA